MIEYDKAAGISTYSKSQLKKICSLYIKNFKKLNNVTLRIKEASPLFCTDLFYIGSPAWIIESEERIAENVFIPKTIIVSDKTGEVYESCCRADNINGNTILTKNDIINIAYDHIKYLHASEKTKQFTYTALVNNIYYEVCYKNSEGDYEPVWSIPIECEEAKCFSDACHYLEISDLTGEIIHIMNCHGRYIESEIYGDNNTKGREQV